MFLQLLRRSWATPSAERLVSPSSAHSSNPILQCRSATSRSSLKQLRKPKASAYRFFIAEAHEACRKNMPDAKQPQIFSALAAQWRALDSASKERYKELSLQQHKRDLENFEQNQVSFLSSLSPEQLNELKDLARQEQFSRIKKQVSKIEDSLGKPKKVPNPFGLFARELAESDPSAKLILTEALKKWAALSEEEKQKYRDLFREKSGEYSVAKEEYERRLIRDQETFQKLQGLREKYAVLRRKRNPE